KNKFQLIGISVDITNSPDAVHSGRIVFCIYYNGILLNGKSPVFDRAEFRAQTKQWYEMVGLNGKRFFGFGIFHSHALEFVLPLYCRKIGIESKLDLLFLCQLLYRRYRVRCCPEPLATMHQRKFSSYTGQEDSPVKRRVAAARQYYTLTP